jgi:hypothetical protein
MKTQLSKNFTLEEMIASPAGTRLGISNKPTKAIKEHLLKLAEKTLQPVRDLWGKPIQVNSGYRNPELNKAIGGSATSQHMTGMAADITVGSKAANKELFDLVIKSNVPFDQLIDEYDYRWIHISYNEVKNRQQVLHLK